MKLVIKKHRTLKIYLLAKVSLSRLSFKIQRQQNGSKNEKADIKIEDRKVDPDRGQ